MDEKHDIWISAKDNTFTLKMCAIQKKKKKPDCQAGFQGVQCRNLHSGKAEMKMTP